MRFGRAQQGAAILMAMLTVTLVAAVAAQSVHQQWSLVQVEQSVRTQVQAQWLLRGALDWSRLLLRLDAQSAGRTDYLAEPWAIPLQETKVSSFVRAHAGVAQDDASSDFSDAYLSGWVEDMQSKINLQQAFVAGVSAEERIAASHAVERLFERLGLPRSEYVRLQEGLRQAGSAESQEGDRPLMPKHLDDLVWLGLSAETVEALAPHAMVWEAKTKINVNTAGATVIWAVAPGMSWGQAQALVQARAQQHFKRLGDAQQQITGVTLSDAVFTVQSDLFVANGQIRMGELVRAMQSELERENAWVQSRSARTLGSVISLPAAD